MSNPTFAEVKANTPSFEDFEKLTVGRRQNLGTLKVVKSGGRITGLKCVNHHVSPFFIKEKVTERTAQALKDAFETAVNNELDRLAIKVRQPARSSDRSLEEKINEMRTIFAEQMSIHDPNSRVFKPLSRAKIGEIIDQVKNFKRFLSYSVSERDNNRDILMFKAMNVTKFAPGELEKLDASVFDRVSFDDISRLAQKVHPLTAGSVKRFADMVDKLAGILAKKAEKNNNDKDLIKFVGGELTPGNIRRAAVKSCLDMNASVLAVLKEARRLTPDDFKKILQQQMVSMKHTWELAVKPNGDFDNLAHGMYWEFLRCQSDVHYYEQFVFNGQKAPQGVEGEELDRFSNTQQINAGLQRKMKEMIPNRELRTFVTSMCGMEGFIGLPGFNKETQELDFGYGSLMTLDINGGLGTEGTDRPHSRLFEFSVDENRNLIFTQKVNFVPQLAFFCGGEDGRAVVSLKDDDRFVVSKNVLELKMRIPLDQVVKPGEMPKVHIMSITQTIEDQEPNVYTV